MEHGRSLNLVFLGSGAFGLPTLRLLATRHRVLMIVTQPDRPAGRGGKLTPTPIAEWAATSLPDVPILKPERINDTSVVERIRGTGADAFVVIAFGQKLGKPLLEDIPAMNLHASQLPRWRGAAPINAAILAGDEITGNSVITLADRMDAGLVLASSSRPIPTDVTAGELHDALAEDGAPLVAEVLEGLRRTGRLLGRTQDESRVTLAPKLSRADALLDFNHPADSLRRRIHGLTPWPGVSVRLSDTRTGQSMDLKLLRVQDLPADHEQGAGPASSREETAGPASATAPTAPQHPAAGSLVDPTRGIVRCGPSGESDADAPRATALRLIEVQPAGKRPMGWDEFRRGLRMGPHAMISSVPSPPPPRPDAAKSSPGGPTIPHAPPIAGGSPPCN